MQHWAHEQILKRLHPDLQKQPQRSGSRIGQGPWWIFLQCLWQVQTCLQSSKRWIQCASPQWLEQGQSHDQVLRIFLLQYVFEFFFLHRYEGNVLKDLKIIDLQLLRLSRPTLDLANFYANSTMPKFRQKHEKEWNDLFYQELSSTLTKLGYDPGAVYPKARFLQDLVDFDVWLLHYSFTRCLVS